MGTVAEGRDTYCLDAYEPGRFARGVTLVAQRCYHRLITVPRTLRGGEDEADFGMDLAGMIGQTDTPALVAARLGPSIRNELLKDPAVDDVTVTITQQVESSPSEWSWELEVAVESTDGDVTLIVSASALTVELLGVR